MDKRAITPIVMIIVVIISFLALIAVVPKLFSIFIPEEGDHLRECWALLGTKIVERQVTQGIVDIIDQRCHTSTFTIDSGDFKSEDHFSKTMADLMGRVWYTVHEGSIEEMWDGDGLTDISLFDNSQCSVVAVVNIEGNYDEEISAENFTNYLLETTYLDEEQGRAWAYADYFQFYGQQVLGTERPSTFAFLPADLSLQTDTSYGIAVSSFEAGAANDILTYWKNDPVLQNSYSVPFTNGYILTPTALVLQLLTDENEPEKIPTLLVLGTLNELTQAGCALQTQAEN